MRDDCSSAKGIYQLKPSIPDALLRVIACNVTSTNIVVSKDREKYCLNNFVSSLEMLKNPSKCQQNVCKVLICI